MIQTCAHCGKPVALVTTPKRLRRTVERIAGLVAAELAVTKRQILSRSKYEAATEARNLCYWVARKSAKVGVAQIGRAFGRHHTTVLHGLREAERRIVADPALAKSARRLVAQAARVEAAE